jgi:hypothetical protein
MAHRSTTAAVAESSGHTGTGWPTRETLADAPGQRLPAFQTCRSFMFEFGRDQVWPITDRFEVTIDQAGGIARVSALEETTAIE